MKHAITAIAIAALIQSASAVGASRVPWEARWQNPVNRNLWRIARCETGGVNNGRPLWTHRARSEHAGLDYQGALGFLETTWDAYKPRGFPAGAHQATPAQQYAVGRILVRKFGGYSSWPACHRRLGLG